MRPIVTCLIVLLGVACRVAPPALSDADKNVIRASIDTFVVNTRAHRDSVTAMDYTENGVFLPPNQGAVEGRAAIRAWFQQFPPMSEFTLTAIDIDGRGDLAYVRGTYALTITGPDGKAAMSDHGKFIEIRRKQPSGRWLMSADIFNSDLPATTNTSR
ncbi:MAG: YybH family protein [Gemmatimonadales bacterium]